MNGTKTQSFVSFALRVLPALSLVTSAALALALAGCAAEESAPEAVRADPALSGWYAERTRIGSLQAVPGLEPYATVSSFFMVTQLIVEDGRAFIEEHFCHSDIVGGPIQVIVSDTFTQSIKAPRVELRVTEEGGAKVYSHPGHPIPVGVKLADPDKDPLPTEADDPRVFDQDGDGKPGVTATVPGDHPEEIYVVRRERYTFSFKQIDERHFAGPFVDLAEQNVIGASTPVLDFTPGVSPDPSYRDDIIFVRTDSAMTCDSMMAASGSLFTP